MPISNLLHLNVHGSECIFTTTMSLSSLAVKGTIVMVHDKEHTGISGPSIWNSVLQDTGNTHSVCYVVTTYKGAVAYTYIGKTMHTLKMRYAKGPSGGLKEVIDKYINWGGGAVLSITVYFCSSPSFLEGLCFQLAEMRVKETQGSYKIVNKIDPN